MDEYNKMKIFIFGCSKRAKNIESALSKIKSIEIIGYVDNDNEKWGSYFFGRKVYSPDEAYITYSKNEAIYFLIAPQNFLSIKKQLKELGAKRIFAHLFELLDSVRAIKEDFDVEGNNKILLVSNGGLPREDNRYRSGFVHRRILAYKRSGVDLDSYGYTGVMGIDRYEYDGNLVYEGDGYGLSYLMSRNDYSKILLHFPTEEILYYIEKYISDTSKVYIWLHGFEILNWERRIFNYTSEEIENNYTILTNKDEANNKFFRRIFNKRNYNFVFVSNWLKDIVEEDIGMLPRHYRIIPNYIDTDLFQYIRKEKEEVSKVLLIKSNNTRMYANDIAAKAIENLSARECFSQMEFNIYGDGVLFDDNYKDLIEKDYSNVHIHRKFLTQSEVSELHRSHGIFLCPTRQDTHGVSMCEAMSSGLVVVTNNVAAIPEYINNTVGVLCDDEDYIGMADALERLFNDRSLFMQYSKSAPEFINEKCGYANTIQLELDMMNQV